ncbi:AMP-binding protein [candidate division KSB1 bacterium]|nr:AMP-binding protein [candidate division KSB1 bacterium]
MLDRLENLTLFSVLESSAEHFAEKPALSLIDTHPMTYAELRAQVQQLSLFLYDQGIIHGDRVALLSENKPNWVIAYLAIVTMGAVAVPILPDFHASEVQHILRHSRSKAIFISERLYDKLEEGHFDDLDIFLIDDFSVVPSQISKDRLSDMIKSGEIELTKIKQAALKLSGRIPSKVQEQDLASIIYTSGTTGHSKGVMLTHKNIVFDAIATLDIQTVTSTDRLLSILPLSHTYENTIGMMIPLICGAAIYYIEKPPTARVLIPAMEKIKPTMMLTVPLIIEKIFKTRILPQLTKNKLMRSLYRLPPMRKQLHRLAGKKLYKLFGGHLHFFGIGGASLSPEVERFLREANFPYAIGYGLTETSPLIAGTSPDKTRFRSTGPALPKIELKIVPQNAGQKDGEIWVRGENVMKGYFKDPERTQEVITSDGWLKTGDLGELDKDGYLYIKGRLKNMLLGPSGENIYPEQIESVLNESDHVLESLVFQQEGRLVARIHLNYERLDEEFHINKLSDAQYEKKIRELLDSIRQQTNERLSTFSRLQRMIEQPEPFEKTPTQKIKRYLYIN